MGELRIVDDPSSRIWRYIVWDDSSIIAMKATRKGADKALRKYCKKGGRREIWKDGVEILPDLREIDSEHL